MSLEKFKAMIISETEEGKFVNEISEKSIEDLPEGDVLIEVKYSSLNYKDALSFNGNKGVTRHYPHTPGIDAAGIIADSQSESFEVGEEVLVTGYDLGMNTSGGFQEYIRVPSEWVVRLPKGLSLKESMVYGTAGLTAAISVYKLIHNGVKVDDGNILVTGATGGVGSIAVSILSKLGYSVVAATGKVNEQKDMLIKLGAKEVIDRKEVNDESGRALLRGEWAGVVDTVGGNMLATAIKSTKYDGTVTACGNVLSTELSTSIFPFILRGVSLMGVDSVQIDMETRLEIWEKMAGEWKIDHLEEQGSEIGLNELKEKLNQILVGKHSGRTIVNLQK